MCTTCLPDICMDKDPMWLQYSDLFFDHHWPLTPHSSQQAREGQEICTFLTALSHSPENQGLGSFFPVGTWRPEGCENRRKKIFDIKKSKLLTAQQVQEGLEIDEVCVGLWSLRGVGQSMENCSLCWRLPGREENKRSPPIRRCLWRFDEMLENSTETFPLALSFSLSLPPARRNLSNNNSLIGPVLVHRLPTLKRIFKKIRIIGGRGFFFS